MRAYKMSPEILACCFDGVAGLAAVNFAGAVLDGQPAGFDDSFLAVLLWAWREEPQQAAALVATFVLHARAALSGMDPVLVAVVLGIVSNDLQARGIPTDPAMLAWLHPAIVQMVDA